MRARVVWFENTGEEREVTSGCFRCGVSHDDLDGLREVVVSPSGKAHFGAEYGLTQCGIDATADGWWWPL